MANITVQVPAVELESNSAVCILFVNAALLHTMYSTAPSAPAPSSLPMRTAKPMTTGCSNLTTLATLALASNWLYERHVSVDSYRGALAAMAV